MIASHYKCTATSAEDITFISTDGNPLWVMILCIVKKKKTTSVKKHAVAIIFDSFHSNKVLGHVPFYWSELETKHWSKTRDTS